VLRVALRVIDESSPDGFTMRRVADALGIGVMTLYGYVADKAELLQGVTELAFAETGRPTAPGARWDERLGADVIRLHGVARRHPQLVSLVLAQSSAVPGLFRMRERMLGALLQAGFDAHTALHALGVVCHYAVGFAGAQAAAPPFDLPERIRELPPADFPRLAAVAGDYAEHLSDEAFAFGLELLLDGLRARQAGAAR
jgi:AcrR family transcriptional regulator